MTDSLRYPLLIFDWDGTIVDSHSRITNAMLEAFEACALTPPSEAQIGQIIGLGLSEAVQVLCPEADQATHAQLISNYRVRFLGGAEQARAFAGVEDMLADLRAQDYVLTVATGKSRRGLEQDLDQTGLRRFFSYTRCVSECASKPDPEMVEQILVHEWQEPGHALVIGDTEFDLLMARNAGCDAVGVSCGAHTVEQLASATPLAVLGNVVDLPGFLRQF